MLRRPAATALVVACLAAAGCATRSAAGVRMPLGTHLRLQFATPRDVRVLARQGGEEVAFGVVRVEGRVLGVHGDTITLDVTGPSRGLWDRGRELTGPGVSWTTASVVRTPDTTVERTETSPGRTLVAVVLIGGALATAWFFAGLASLGPNY